MLELLLHKVGDVDAVLERLELADVQLLTERLREFVPVADVQLLTERLREFVPVRDGVGDFEVVLDTDTHEEIEGDTDTLEEPVDDKLALPQAEREGVPVPETLGDTVTHDEPDIVLLTVDEAEYVVVPVVVLDTLLLMEPVGLVDGDRLRERAADADRDKMFEALCLEVSVKLTDIEREVLSEEEPEMLGDTVAEWQPEAEMLPDTLCESDGERDGDTEEDGERLLDVVPHDDSDEHAVCVLVRHKVGDVVDDRDVLRVREGVGLVEGDNVPLRERDGDGLVERENVPLPERDGEGLVERERELVTVFEDWPDVDAHTVMDGDSDGLVVDESEGEGDEESAEELEAEVELELEGVTATASRAWVRSATTDKSGGPTPVDAGAATGQHNKSNARASERPLGAHIAIFL